MAVTEFKKVDLYGGAIQSDIPTGYLDVSDIREVPDHQEVYLDSTGQDNIIFDILERVDSVDTDEAALRFHGEDILDDEPDIEFTDLSKVKFAHLPEDIPTLACVVKKRPNQAGTYHAILLALIRLKDKNTDLVISYNAHDVQVGDGEEQRMALAKRVMDRIMDTFEIKDWNLFVQE